MKELIVFGGASQKIIQIFKLTDLKLTDTTLLDFLMGHNIPVASSCLGEGICKKCVALINGEKLLTCELSLRDLFQHTDSQTLSFSYL
jgi:ferredoxin